MVTFVSAALRAPATETRLASKKMDAMAAVIRSVLAVKTVLLRRLVCGDGNR